MKQLQIGMTGTLLAGVLAVTTAWGQTPLLQQVEEQLHEQHRAAAAHHQQMQGITDPQQFSAEMRRHFRMTEDIMVLMLQRQKLMDEQAAAGDAPQRGASGGHLGRHAPGAGPGSGQPEPPAGGAERGAPGGPLRQHGKAPGQGGGMPGGEPPGAPADAPQRSAPGGHLQRHGKAPGQGSEVADLELMLQRLREHSVSMETITDRALLTQEMRRHQQMLDQMLERLQQ
jgi:hypothetical protein